MGDKTEAINTINDNISAVYVQLKEMTTPIREDVLITQGIITEDDHEAEIAARIWVSKQVEADASITHYHDPSDSVLEGILERAKAYSGDWYHSSVVLVMTEQQGNQWTPLQQAIYDLPDSAGVYRSYQYDIDDIDDLYDAIMRNKS